METFAGNTARAWATVLLLAAGLAGATAAQATLMARDLNGDTVTDAYWDSVLNITWLKNANLADSDTFGVSGAGRSMNWVTAQAWITAMNTANYLGYSDWRLPTMNSTSPFTGTLHDCSSGSATDCKNSGNELGYMYYFNLGGTGNDLTGDLTVGGVTLDNIQPGYWSGTEFDSGNDAWSFLFNNGLQGIVGERLRLSAWAVRPGDVAAAPEPASLLLIGAGMLGLGWSRRRGRRR
jgi:hypothetical protein